MNRRATLVVLWCVGVGLFAAGATYWRWTAMIEENERAGLVAHRIVSQRADQHDAHMTSLSALALTTETPPRDAMQLVAATIGQFYPRIAAIDLVSLSPDHPDVLMTTRSAMPGGSASLIRDAALQASQKPALVRSPGRQDRYLLIKRVPNSQSARYALSLEIDAAALGDLDGTSPPATDLVLAMPDGSALASPTATGMAAGNAGPAVITFEKTLGSASQPLTLRLSREASVMAVVPWVLIALFGGLSALAIGGYRIFVAARVAEREAKMHASFREQEVRLAHASRVNAMGELSLGIAHELTQPLAAILSQSQAGLRMTDIEPFDRGAVVKVLEANVRHARRAGAILAKLRDWVSAKPGRHGPVDLNRVLSDVVALTRGDFETRGVTALLSLAEPAPVAIADHVELEQIAYNLACNAADACTSVGERPRVVRLTTFADPAHVGFEVRDAGPGLTPDALQRIFEPFYTSKPDGMGLGLALCQRLVDRIGGQIKAANHTDGGAVFTVVLPASPSDREIKRQAAE